MNEKVETVMIKKLITLSPLDTLDHATKIFSDKRICLLYTSDDADERSSVDLGGRRIIKKKT